MTGADGRSAVLERQEKKERTGSFCETADVTFLASGPMPITLHCEYFCQKSVPFCNLNFHLNVLVSAIARKVVSH